MSIAHLARFAPYHILRHIPRRNYQIKTITRNYAHPIFKDNFDEEYKENGIKNIPPSGHKLQETFSQPRIPSQNFKMLDTKEVYDRIYSKE